MATVWGALGQTKPLATTLTNAYTVPSTKHATVQVVMANVGAAANVRVSHSIAGASDALSQYLVYDLAIPAGTTVSTAKFVMNATDIIRVYSSTGNVTFHINGIEET